MSEFGLSEKGFKRKRYADVISGMEARARDLFGESINLSPASPLGVILRIVAWAVAIVWQVAEQVYHSAYADTATGQDLDKVAKYIGITRRAARRATGVLLVTGDPGAVVPQGMLVATVDGIQFETTGEAQITAGGSVQVSVQALAPGLGGNVPTGTITAIVTPYPGLSSITNPQALTGGQERETDHEFRRRYTLSVATAGASTVDSIRATLLQVAGVTAALVEENPTMEETDDGQPPKSLVCYVLGGAELDVGKAILRTKAAGIQAWGSTQVIVKDSAGSNHTVGFTRATQVDVEVSVTLTVGAQFPLDGLAQVQTAIIRYIGGEDESGQEYVGLGLGESVVYTRLIAAVYQVPGILDAVVTLNREGEAPGSANLVIERREVAVTDHTRIAVATA